MSCAERAALAALLEETPESLYEEAPCGYVSVLPDGALVKLNRTFAEWLGYAADRLLGRRLQTLLAVGSRIYYETHFAPLLAMQGYVSEIAMDLTDCGGNIVPVLINARQRRDEQGTVRLVRMVVFHAAERRRYERELLRERERAAANARAKAELLQMLGHDVRTPLASILNSVHLLGRTLSDETLARPMRIIETSARNLLALVQTVLDAERLEAGVATLAHERFDLRELLAQIVEEFAAGATAKGVALVLDIDPFLPAPLDGDAVRLGQIFTNLIGNSLKFTATGAVRVTVRVRERASETVTLDCAVEDTGVGIAPDHLERIVEPFGQVPGEARKHDGVGLGLAICRRILRLHESELTVASTVGVGSRFGFALRLARAGDVQ